MLPQVSSLDLFYSLIVANVAVYVLALVGIVRARLKTVARIRNIQDAFAFLEKSLKESFPDLPEGFTWSEVVTRLKSSRFADERDLDWSEIESILRKYEAYRYGGFAYDGDVKAVLKLAMSLPRYRRGGETYASGSEVESN